MGLTLHGEVGNKIFTALLNNLINHFGQQSDL